jgi:uncharacterized damage-inducible protein DinB
VTVNVRRADGVCYGDRMVGSLLDDAFDHHVWATIRLIDACAELDPAQLETSVPGTYGSILDTQCHVVVSDANYLFVLSGERTPQIDQDTEDTMDLPELRAVMERNGEGWAKVLSEGPDPHAMTLRRRDDGSETRAPVGLRLAQALHHGTDHRSQVCTAISSLGVVPPEIDLWALGEQVGTVVETPATS